MKILIIFLISLKSFSYKAVVEVLEAPVFRKPDIDEKVFLYLRKGDQLTIHKSDLSEDFYKALSKTGDEVYILKDHVHVYYKSLQELEQISMEFDETDYRIPEPLPKKYPIKQETGYKGYLSIGFGSFNAQNFSYKDKVLDSSKDSLIQVNYVWLKNFKNDLSQRVYIGGIFNLFKSSSTFLFQNYNSEETNIKLGFGPYISYDTLKKAPFIITLYTSLTLNLLDQLNINRNELGQKIQAEYSTTSLISNSGAYISFENIVPEFDGIIGLAANFSLPSKYKKESSDNSLLFDKSFKTSFKTALNVFIGIQSNY